MRGVDMCKIKWSLYEDFLKVTLTKYCTVEQEKRQGLKTHVIATKNELEPSQNTKNLLKPMQITAKTKRQAARKHPDTRSREAQR